MCNYKLKKHIAAGNNKLPETTAIFNMCSAADCPAAKLGLCQLKDTDDCYARKAEIQYKNVIPYRNRQKEIFQSISATNFVFQFNEMNARKRNKFNQLRVSEAGDFDSQKDVDKLSKIANNLEIITYCYTARKDLNFKDRGKLNINGSNFMVDNMFIAAKFAWLKIQALKAKGFKKVILCAADCKKCNICAIGKGYIIVAKKH